MIFLLLFPELQGKLQRRAVCAGRAGKQCKLSPQSQKFCSEQSWHPQGKRLSQGSHCWSQATSLIKNVSAWKAGRERGVLSGKAELHPSCRVVSIPHYFLLTPIFLQPCGFQYCWIRWSEFSTEPGWSRRLDQSCPLIPTNPGDAVTGRAVSS